MKNIKKLFILTLAIFTVQIAAAQSGRMKDPVSFTLKNGLTLVVAENDGADKVFSGFTSEARPGAQICKTGAQEVLHTMLNSLAVKTGDYLTFNDKGGNINADPEVFDKALQSLFAIVAYTVFNEQDFSIAKAELIKSVAARDRFYDESVTPSAINQLTLLDITVLYNALMTPSSCILTIAGNIKATQARAVAKKTFGNWKGSAIAELSSK